MLIFTYKNSNFNRNSSLLLFFIFVLISSLRDLNFNDDTVNYVANISGHIGESISLNSFFSWGWEPGYNAVVILFSHLSNSKEFVLFFITILPVSFLIYSFIKYKYHPAIIFFFYSTILWVTATTTMRHWWAISISFFVLNKIIYEKKSKIYLFFLPLLFHLSSIVLVVVLIINRIKGKLTINKVLIIVLFIVVILFYLQNYMWIISEKLSYSSSASRVIGFRNLINIVLFLMFIIYFVKCKKIILNFSKVNFLIFSSLIISIVLMPYYGLNRITSFFTLILLSYLNYYKRLNIIYILIIDILSLISLYYFSK